MKPIRIYFTIAVIALIATALQTSNAAVATGKADIQAAQATAAATSALATYAATDPGADISVGPAKTTPTATPAMARTPNANPINNPGGTPGATAVAAPPIKITPPATLADLLKQFPDLAPYINSTQSINDMDLADLYKKMVEVYTKAGGAGLATFLKDSGLLEKFNLPVSYLDLLVVYDQGGLPAVQKLAVERGLINSQNEIVAYVTLADDNALQQVIADMTKLGVTTYPPLDSFGQLQIGIPLEVLSNYQTPGTLIKYLTQVANVKNVSAVHPPMPKMPMGKVNLDYFKGKGPSFVGAKKWQDAGYTGKGVRIGILDMGFGGIKKLMNGTDLPKNLKTIPSLDELDQQNENHGTACAEVVHGAAPDAELFIAYFDDNASFRSALEFLLTNKVQIISYSIGSAIGPRDGTFGESVLVDEIVQKTGILWVNAAGNEAVDHTMFTYNDSAGDGQHHFSDQDAALPFVAYDPHTNVTMNWNGNWNGGEKDEYDFTILDKDGNEVATASEPKKGRKNDYPFQIVDFDATPEAVYYMVVKKVKGNTDATIDIFINNGLLPEWARVPDHSITVPADSNSALSVGATGLTKDKIEFYSSQGPTNDGRIKPDLSAPTGEVLPDEPDGFNGTSGATPLISGVAGLVLQAYPQMTAAELKAFLTTNVKDLGDAGPDNVFGAGRIKLPDPSTINSDQGPDTNPTTSPDDNSGDSTPIPTPAKKTPVPTKVPKTAGPVATIKSTDVKFNVTVKGVKGVKISASFEIDNFKGKQGVIALQVLQPDGKTAVKPKTQDYSVGKTLGTGLTFQPKYDQTAYDDVPLFLPNSEFGNLKSGTNDLVYVITILDFSDENNPKILVQSDPQPITVTKK